VQPKVLEQAIKAAGSIDDPRLRAHYLAQIATLVKDAQNFQRLFDKCRGISDDFVRADVLRAIVGSPNLTLFECAEKEILSLDDPVTGPI